jgi:heme/copper-type cytochrome/quinol oxidase subunit 4
MDRKTQYFIVKAISVGLGVLAMTVGTYTGFLLGVEKWLLALGVFVFEALIYIVDQFLFFWILEQQNKREVEMMGRLDAFLKSEEKKRNGHKSNQGRS